MRTTLTFLLLSLLFSGCQTPLTEAQQKNSWPPPGPLEASGLAFLPEQQLILSHEDDTETKLFAWNRITGQAYEIALPRTTNRDWEDITVIPRGDANPIIVIGEIGDNAARYPTVRLDFFEIKGLDAGYAFAEAEFLGSQPFQYPEGPRDAESLLYDPIDQSLWVITKRDDPPQLYKIPYPKDFSFSANPEPVRAELLGPIPGIPEPTAEFLIANPRFGRWSDQPTGADISPDGSKLAIITYNDLHLYQRQPGQSWQQVLRGPPVSIDIPQLQQVEAVCFGIDSDTLYYTTEGKDPILIELPLSK